MHILEKLKQAAAEALTELNAKPWLSDYPKARQLYDELGHALGDYGDTIVPRPTHRTFLDGVDGRLFPSAESEQVYIRLRNEQEMLREVGHMIPVWVEHRNALARETVVDNFKKITRVRALCAAIAEQEFVATHE